MELLAAHGASGFVLLPAGQAAITEDVLTMIALHRLKHQETADRTDKLLWGFPLDVSGLLD